MTCFQFKRAHCASGIADENKTTLGYIAVTVGAWEPRKFPTNFQRDSWKRSGSKCFWTSEQQYWETGYKNKGIKNSERKLSPAWNSVCVRMCFPKKEEDLGGKDQEGPLGERWREVPGQGWLQGDSPQRCQRALSTTARAGQQAPGHTFLGRWDSENNSFTQICWEEIYKKGQEFRVKSQRNREKGSKWKNLLLTPEDKSFEG